LAASPAKTPIPITTKNESVIDTNIEAQHLQLAKKNCPVVNSNSLRKILSKVPYQIPMWLKNLTKS
jgi:hypothetical protein